jgi:hypothetical protein
MLGREKRTARGCLTCQPTVRRANPLGGGGRTWSQGEIWTGKAHDVARTKKEGEGGLAGKRGMWCGGEKGTRRWQGHGRGRGGDRLTHVVRSRGK